MREKAMKITKIVRIMKTLTITAFLIASFPANALADTALALGCAKNGWIFGYGSNYPTEEGAAEAAMQHCTARGAQCKVIRTFSGGGYMAFAEDLKPCGAFG